jgi:predicted O-linked N-acetylglucosamine transferase (SPINDLY family)
VTPKELLEQALPHHQAGRFGEAEPLYRQVLELEPQSFPALHLMGLMRMQQGRLDEAQAFMDAALKVKPGAPETLANYGILLSSLGRLEDALQAFNVLAAAAPSDRAYSNRGAILSKLGRPQEALADFDRALALNSGNADALNNRALMLHELGRHDEALAAFDAVLALAPGYLEGRNSRGVTLKAMGRAPEALEEFDRMLAAQPGHAGALINRANILWGLQRLDEAMDSYDRVIALHPDQVEALESRSNLLWTRRQALAPAIADLERVLQLAPDLPFARGNLLHLKMHAGDWRGFARDKAQLDDAVRAGKPAVMPFVYQGLSDDPADLLACAVTYANREHPALPPMTRSATRRPGRIRIGYVSGEFRAQATMYLAAGLFEAHDRDRFEIFAFDNGRDDHSPMRRRVMAAFDEFVSIAALSERDAGRAVAARDVDILVNLNGYFGKLRMDLFACRAAPIQVNYLGFPGTLGADYMDYILADATVIPHAAHRFYREKVVTLPDSYQVNDSKRAPAGQSSRAAHGLPEGAFIFCHFNYSYKITPDVFACWMRILKAVPQSLLWLLSGNPIFTENIKAEAGRAGVDPARILFAPPLEWEQHLARLALGDLFLDSLPSNAHTSASDALWAGLPLLTCQGHAFQGRVAAGLLKAAGLPELVTETLESYEALATRLARDSKLLDAYRRRLAENRRTAPIFDTARTARHIEWAYETMQARRQNGEAPASFAVPSLQA